MMSSVISAPSFVLFEDLRRERAELDSAISIHAALTTGTADPGWQEVDGLLLFQDRILVPDDSALWPQLLAAAHAGHEGVQKSLHRFRASFYNKHSHRRIKEFVQGCAVCQKNKTEHLHPAGVLQPLPVPSEVWTDIAMDFIEEFPKVGGKSVILNVVDRFSKFAHFIP